MKAYDAIQTVVKSLDGNEYLIACNGYISRYLYAIKDRPRNFYMLGSMGMASSIGLGLAIAKPNEKVIILDGDGNLLMNMNTLATIGNVTPKKFIHIVLDNESHESTGGQRTSSETTRLDLVAKSSGFKNVRMVSSEDELYDCVKKFLKIDGPSFVLCKVERGRVDVERVGINPLTIKNRFMRSLETIH